MKIKVKVFNPACKFSAINKGEWIDLRAAEDVVLNVPYAERLRKNKTVREVVYDYNLIPLGIGMQLPKGFEAIIAPRSSSFKQFGIIETNSIGVIDSSFRGSDDQWCFPCVSFKNKTIHVGDRICQFRIQLSQKATIWQKVKWLFNNKIEFEFVNDYEGVNRGGFGSTGV